MDRFVINGYSDLLHQKKSAKGKTGGREQRLSQLCDTGADADFRFPAEKIKRGRFRNPPNRQ